MSAAFMRDKSVSGFTLIETMIGLALTSVILFTAMYVADSSSHSLKKKLDNTRALLVLQNFSENLLVANVATTQLTNGSHGPLYFDSEGAEAQQGPISLAWVVTYNAPLTSVMKIDVTASWAQPEPGSRTLTTFKTIPPITNSTSTVPVPLPTPQLQQYSWTYSAWGPCDQATHTKNRTRQCWDSVAGVVVADTLCASSVFRVSSTSATCGYNEWLTSDWSACNSGTTNRTVMCADASGLAVDESTCDASERPEISKTCLSCFPDCS